MLRANYDGVGAAERGGGGERGRESGKSGGRGETGGGRGGEIGREKEERMEVKGEE